MTVLNVNEDIKSRNDIKKDAVLYYENGWT